MKLVTARLGWSLVVSHDGRPYLVGPERGTLRRRPLHDLATAPRLARRVQRQLDRWIATAEVNYPEQTVALRAARAARAELARLLEDYALAAVIATARAAAVVAVAP